MAVNSKQNTEDTISEKSGVVVATFALGLRKSHPNNRDTQNKCGDTEKE